MRLNDPLLKRFWFKTETGYGIGVTAYSLEDANSLIKESDGFIDKKIVEVTENVDIRTLDQGHVIPNMGAPNFRGIWFPNLIR
jgi:hypothetical protein